MTYSTALRRYQSTSIVRWKDQDWHIIGLNRLAKTATLMPVGGYETKEASLKEVTE